MIQWFSFQGVRGIVWVIPWYCLGSVEGLNNKIRVLQRRAYGYRDQEFLKRKIIAVFLPPAESLKTEN